VKNSSIKKRSRNRTIEAGLRTINQIAFPISKRQSTCWEICTTGS